MTENLNNEFVNDLVKTKRRVQIYLVNGIKLEGQLIAADNYSVMLLAHTHQLIYKHSISTIMAAELGKPMPKVSHTMRGYLGARKHDEQPFG